MENPIKPAFSYGFPMVFLWFSRPGIISIQIISPFLALAFVQVSVGRFLPPVMPQEFRGPTVSNSLNAMKYGKYTDFIALHI